MKPRKLALVLTPLLLSACVSQYVEPQGPDTATMTVQNAGTMNMTLFAYNVAADCSGGRPKLAPQPLPPGQSVTFKVKGNEAFSFFAGFGEWTVGVGRTPTGKVGVEHRETNCFMPITFTPRSGERYLARFIQSEGKCSPSIVSTSQSGERKEPFRVRDLKITMSADAAAC